MIRTQAQLTEEQYAHFEEDGFALAAFHDLDTTRSSPSNEGENRG